MMLEWITQNGKVLVAIVLGLHAVAVMIVNLTPTRKDNDILGKIYRWIIEPLAGIVTPKAKE